MARTSTTSAVTAIGMDMGKNTLHMIGLDSCGAIVLREKVSRGRITSRLANLPPCLIGIEAGMATHYVDDPRGAAAWPRMVTARFLRHLVKGKTAIALNAVLVSPSEHPPGSSVREGWSIVVGDEVSFGLTEFGAEPAAAATAAAASAGAMQVA